MSATDGHIPEERLNKNTKKSIAAVVAGALVIIVVTTLVDVLLHVVGVFPPMSVPMDDRLSLIATSGGGETARHAA